MLNKLAIFFIICVKFYSDAFCVRLPPLFKWLMNFKYFRNMENARAARAEEAKKFVNDLLDSSKTAEDIKQLVGKLKNKPELRKAILSEDAINDLPMDKVSQIKESKSAKEIIFHFFGMNDNWKLGRNLAGGFMVHAPEYPTYFIPAFTQAKATGDASDMKKGEGPRGIITGMLEGVAVGALVSGGKIKGREMVPYIVLGAALQLFSSKVFPWLGEKMGRQIYLRRQAVDKPDLVVQNPVKEPAQPLQKPDKPEMPAFKGRNLYNNYSTGLKI